MVISVGTILASSNIDPVDDYAEDFCIYLKKHLLAPLESFFRRLSFQDDKNDPIDGGGDDDGV